MTKNWLGQPLFVNDVVYNMTAAAPGRIGRITAVEDYTVNVEWFYQLSHQMRDNKFVSFPINAFLRHSRVAINDIVKIAPENLNWVELEFIKYNSVVYE